MTSDEFGAQSRRKIAQLERPVGWVASIGQGRVVGDDKTIRARAGQDECSENRDKFILGGRAKFFLTWYRDSERRGGIANR